MKEKKIKLNKLIQYVYLSYYIRINKFKYMLLKSEIRDGDLECSQCTSVEFEGAEQLGLVKEKK